MTNGNGSVKWVAIIISVVIAMVSLSIGVIRTSNAEKIETLQQTVNRHEEMITRMRETNARTETQIENVQSQLEQLNKKMDIVLERLGK